MVRILDKRYEPGKLSMLKIVTRKGEILRIVYDPEDPDHTINVIEVSE